ncbi:penicillin-binding protein 1A [Balneicella halophila]|uniref:Penicillin-binding protein 1A n=1 Tax=Balneicella halophila TaxID=1537566 RepID=A0A7L4UR00_BALHA|nr:transglycosylase domain-containing protein [Balneicella halophila]PVX50719.1 penicillin-binding protein 1A [Balneicella halophila]
MVKKSTKTNKKEKKGHGKWIRRFWIAFTVIILFVVGLLIVIDMGLLGYMPSVKDLSGNQNEFASEVYTADGKAIGRYAYKRNRVYSEYKDIPQHLVDALVATEDERFYEHSGIDGKGVLRAIIKMGKDGGGSTITQQLAKNLFPREKKFSKPELVLRKLREWVMAVKLERNYTKEEIITMYLNTYDFLYQAVGIRMAAKVYFNKSPEDLNLNEVAVLVGMCKNPALYNPRLYMDNALNRRNVVLNQMLRNGYINRAVYDLTKTQPIVLNYQKEDHKSGTGTYLREYLRGVLTAKKPEKENYRGWQQQQFYEDSIQWENNPLYGWCIKNTKPDGSTYNIYEDGLKIYTTVDSRMQRYAEEAMREHIGKNLQPLFDKLSRNNKTKPFTGITQKEIDKIMERGVKNSDRYYNLQADGKTKKEILDSFNKEQSMSIFTWEELKDTVLTPYDSIRYYKGLLRGGFMAMEPGTGKVKAYVGGADYSHFMYDMVTKGKRQVGSTFKPLLYTVALQEGMSPCVKTLNVPQTFILPDGNTWTPKNSGKAREGEMVTLKWGLTNSVNNITAWVLKQFTPEAIVKVARNMGIVSPLDPVPALSLGIPDVTVKEMVGAYGTFANKGVYAEPIFVSRIENKNGDVIAEFTTNTREVMSEETAYTMTELLRNVVQQGTGQRLRHRYKIDAPWGGKTGTTDNHSDGWFMSLNPYLVTGTWVGGEDRSVHFQQIAYGQGANMALPIFGLFIQKVYADETINMPRDYFTPPVRYNVDLNCDDNPDEENPETIEEEEVIDFEI